MKELLNVLDILKGTTPRVLATLGRVEGSSYRRAGARLVWAPDQPRIGSISGGCLEDDLLERAREVLATGEARTVVYDTTSENDLVWGVGLGCHGVVTVLLEPVRGLPWNWALLRDSWAKREAVVFLTVIRASSLSLLGTRFARSASGQTARDGLELPGAGQLAHDTLKEGRSRNVSVQIDGGIAEVFCEFLPPPLALTVFGAGDDAQPLVRLANELGWSVAVCDPRAAYATRQRFPEAAGLHVFAAESAASLPWDDRSVAVVMTHHYRYDAPILRALLPLQLPYLGLLGPKKRAERILDDLARDGLVVTPAMRDTLRAPVGLDLGGSSPEEVAFSVIAEIQAVLNARDARPLRERARPIHE